MAWKERKVGWTPSFLASDLWQPSEGTKSDTPCLENVPEAFPPHHCSSPSYSISFILLLCLLAQPSTHILTFLFDAGLAKIVRRLDWELGEFPYGHYVFIDY